MQEYQRPDGEKFYKVLVAETTPKLKALAESVRQAEAAKGNTLVRQWVGVGRNDPCPCNSGKKFKKCHLLLAREAGQLRNR